MYPFCCSISPTRRYFLPLTMDPRYSAQDFVRCVLCRDAVVPMYCNVCHTHLCKDCIEKHFSDKSKVHNVVPLEQFLSTFNYPKCPTHPTKQCELHCEQCDIPICTICISSGKNIRHEVVNIFDSFESNKDVLKDLEKLQKLIFPTYQQFADFTKYEKLTKEMHTSVAAFIEQFNTMLREKQSEINDMNSQHLAAIKNQEHEINKKIMEIEHLIWDFKMLLVTSSLKTI